MYRCSGMFLVGDSVARSFGTVVSSSIDATAVAVFTRPRRTDFTSFFDLATLGMLAEYLQIHDSIILHLHISFLDLLFSHLLLRSESKRLQLHPLRSSHPPQSSSNGRVGGRRSAMQQIDGETSMAALAQVNDIISLRAISCNRYRP